MIATPRELTSLMPGVTPPLTNPNPVLDPQRNRVLETNGQSSGANRRTLDGVENDEPFNGTGIYVTLDEGVQQMHLITSNYDAQEGRAAGTILNNIIRTGTNDIHGALFEFNSVSAPLANAHRYYRTHRRHGSRRFQRGSRLDSLQPRDGLAERREPDSVSEQHHPGQKHIARITVVCYLLSCAEYLLRAGI